MLNQEKLRKLAESRGEFTPLPPKLNKAALAFMRFLGQTEEDRDDIGDENALKRHLGNLKSQEISNDIAARVPVLDRLKSYLAEQERTIEKAKTEPEPLRAGSPHQPVQENEEPEQDREQEA